MKKIIGKKEIEKNTEINISYNHKIYFFKYEKYEFSFKTYEGYILLSDGNEPYLKILSKARNKEDFINEIYDFLNNN